MQQEIFGPVLPIATFETLDQAIAYANDCEYGLTSSIYTRSLDVAMRAANELKFGETYVNARTSRPCRAFTPDGGSPASAARTANTVWRSTCRPTSST